MGTSRLQEVLDHGQREGRKMVPSSWCEAERIGERAPGKEEEAEAEKSLEFFYILNTVCGGGARQKEGARCRPPASTPD